MKTYYPNYLQKLLPQSFKALINETANWTTFRNEQYGFELRHSADMGVQQMDTGDHPIGVFEIKTFYSGKQNTLGIEIAIVPETDSQLGEMGERPRGTVSEKNITIDGVAGKYFTITQGGDTGEEVWIKNRERVYIFKGIEPIFSKILSTFKFIR